MDRINKFLKSLSVSRKKEVEVLVDRIVKNDLVNLDCKKLRGFSDIYRVRSGNVRILFRKTKNGGNVIISIESRKKDTYKNL